MPASPTQRTPKKNGVWAVLLACAFFAAIFLLVYIVGKIVEKGQSAYERWRVHSRRAAKEVARAHRPPLAEREKDD
jgi:lipopolysaccharide/colanic/teichoic acid biosynthesis glycosyltransferase